MKNNFFSRRGLLALPFVSALCLQIGTAKADTSPSGLSLPPHYSLSNPGPMRNDYNAADSAAALQSLDAAQSYSPLYNPAWFYDLEIFNNQNLTQPSGSYTGTGQAPGNEVVTTIENPTGASPNIRTDPAQFLAFAQQNSPSYSDSWATDTALFLNRDGSGPAPTDVPEPGSLPILAGGLLGLTIIRLVRRKVKLH